LCACFTDWQSASDRANRTKLIQILLGSISTGDKRDWFANCTRITVLSTSGSKIGKMCEEWKRSYTRILFLTDSTQLVQRDPYHGNSRRMWRLTD
jgi:hypothetical protein